jgi:hypothetical protein
MSRANPLPKEETKTDIARRYRDDHGPEMPTLKLARIMYRQNNLAFKDVEQARSFLRSIEGKMGKGSSNIKVTHNAPPRPYNPYKLPESDETEYEPYKIKGHRRVAVFSDIHAPYHSKEAITAAILQIYQGS